MLYFLSPKLINNQFFLFFSRFPFHHSTQFLSHVLIFLSLPSFPKIIFNIILSNHNPKSNPSNHNPISNPSNHELPTQTHQTQITEHDLASPWLVLGLLSFHSPISAPSSPIWPRCGSHEVERERVRGSEKREKILYKMLIFGLWMNSGSTV